MADELLLANPGKHEEIGLAEVVLASVSPMNRAWCHSPAPKDGTEGNDSGAEGISISLFSPRWPKLVQLLFTRGPNMTVSVKYDCWPGFTTL